MENGKINKYDPQKVADYIKSRMKGRYLVDDIVQIVLNLNFGESQGTAWGCDLSKKYVEINSEYTTWFKSIAGQGITVIKILYNGVITLDFHIIKFLH